MSLAEALREAADEADGLPNTGHIHGDRLRMGQENLRGIIYDAWLAVRRARAEWSPTPGINYPKWRGSETAWPSSEAAIGPVIHLPAGEYSITEPVYLPQCVSLIGPAFGSCNFRFEGDGCLRVLGNLKPPTGEPFQMLRGQVSGIKFVAGDVNPIQLYGDLANWRFTRNHIVGVGLRDKAGIQHVNAYNESTPFGEILTTDGGGHTLKEVDITDNQLEGFSASISISGATNCRIDGNKSIYSNLGIEARNCSHLMITNNSFKGAKSGEAIQPGDQAGIIGSGEAVAIHGNLFSHLDAAAFWRGAKVGPLFASNTLNAVPRGRGGRGSLIDGRWRADKNWGPFREGAKPPYGID